MRTYAPFRIEKIFVTLYIIQLRKFIEFFAANILVNLLKNLSIQISLVDFLLNVLIIFLLTINFA